MSVTAPPDARDRLLLAAAELLHASDGEPISTRAICDRAGVRAPTLYHHFGDKQALLDAVVNHGFRQFLLARRAEAAAHASADAALASADPLADIRAAWDDHVQFGLQHPAFYGLIYGQVKPGRPCGVIDGVKAMILEALTPAARQGRLRVSPADAAEQILAASVGVTLTLITQPAEAVDPGLSARVRDAILTAVSVATPEDGSDTVTAPATATPSDRVAAAAVALAAALATQAEAADSVSANAPLSAGESALLREWLARLSAPRR